MRFTIDLSVDEGQALRALGYKNAPPDAETAARLAKAAAALQSTATPRWVSRRFALGQGLLLESTQLTLPGRDIAAHLAGCTALWLLAVTLGDGAERLTRAAETQDMAHALLLDVAASTLIEQYADEAERLLRGETEAGGEYLTGRFSPGYGDLPIGLQADVLRLLGAQRAIGLTVNEGGILLPRKSITAILGVSGQPVKGRPAGCKSCALREGCAYRKEGKHCGEQDI